MQVIYFDHRGHGRSDRGDPSKYNLDENVEDMEALRQHLGVGSIVSIGSSYGGMVAAAHAARYPDSVSHLILVATASHAGFHAKAMKALAERGTSEQQACGAKLWSGGFTSSDDLRDYFRIMGPLYSRRHDPEAAAIAAQRGILEPEPINCAFRPGGFLRTFDLRPELGNITAPTLIAAGRHDWICAPEFSEEIHGLIAGSELRIFEQSGHSIRADESDQLFDAILGFLVYNERVRSA